MAGESEHLGDGVYISHDGYQVWLAANHHENKTVALEPPVLIQMSRWLKNNFSEQMALRMANALLPDTHEIVERG